MLDCNTESPQLQVLFQLRNFHSDEIRLHFFNWDCFQIVDANIKLQEHLYFAMRYFTLRKPHFCATFFAWSRVTGNTKLDYYAYLKQLSKQANFNSAPFFRFHTQKYKQYDNTNLCFSKASRITWNRGHTIKNEKKHYYNSFIIIIQKTVIRKHAS